MKATIVSNSFHSSRSQENLIIKKEQINGKCLTLTKSQWQKFNRCTCHNECSCGGSTVEVENGMIFGANGMIFCESTLGERTLGSMESFDIYE